MYDWYKHKYRIAVGHHLIVMIKSFYFQKAWGHNNTYTTYNQVFIPIFLNVQKSNVLYFLLKLIYIFGLQCVKIGNWINLKFKQTRKPNVQPAYILTITIFMTNSTISRNKIGNQSNSLGKWIDEIFQSLISIGLF